MEQADQQAHIIDIRGRNMPTANIVSQTQQPFDKSISMSDTMSNPQI